MESHTPIPILYCVQKNLKLRAGPVGYGGGKYTLGETVPVSAIPRLKTGTERGKVLVADVEGLNRGKFNASFMEYCKVQGNDLWLIEPLYDEYDVLDAFIGNADKLVFPYEFVKNDSVLPEIVGISDNCIPSVTVRNGTCKGKPVKDVMRLLSENGFRNIMVTDIDGTVNEDVWDMLHDECGGLLGYSPVKPFGRDMRLSAEDVFPFSRR